MECFYKTLRNFYHGTGGIAAIEFSAVFMIFVFFCFFIFEICRYMFISAAIDLTLTEAARASSAQSSVINYQEHFSKTLKNQSGFWAGFIESSKFNARVSYCQTIAQVISNKCGSVSTERILAVYQLSYDYQPLLFGNAVPGTERLITALKNSLQRRLIYVQEYERDVLFKTPPVGEQ